MRVTLHLGAHRTGMGGLTGALMANAGPLTGAGIATWHPDELRNGLGAGLVRRPGRITLAEEKRGRRAVGRMQLRQTQMAQKGTKRLIVLGPDLLGQPSDCMANSALYPLAGERLVRAAPAFADRCDRVTLSIRRADRWWSSALATAVATGVAVPDADRLDGLVSHPRQWRHIIREIAVAFPKAELIVWPAEVLMDLPERQIAAMTGDPNEPLLTPYRGRQERAPNAEMLERILNERGTPATLRTEPTGQWAPFDDRHIAAFAAQYQEDLAWLRAGAGGRATAIGLDGADLAPPAVSGGQQGADHDPLKTARRLG